MKSLTWKSRLRRAIAIPSAIRTGRANGSRTNVLGLLRPECGGLSNVNPVLGQVFRGRRRVRRLLGRTPGPRSRPMAGYPTHVRRNVMAGGHAGRRKRRARVDPGPRADRQGLTLSQAVRPSCFSSQFSSVLSAAAAVLSCPSRRQHSSPDRFPHGKAHALRSPPGVSSAHRNRAVSSLQAGHDFLPLPILASLPDISRCRFGQCLPTRRSAIPATTSTMRSPPHIRRA